MTFRKKGNKYILSDGSIMEYVDYESVENFINNQITKHQLEIDRLKIQLSQLKNTKMKSQLCHIKK